MIAQLFKKTIFTLLALGAAGFAGSAAAQSAKAAFAYSPLIVLPACSTTTTGCGTTPENTPWTTVLRQNIKLANQKDLFFGASLQCGIVTDTTVASKNATTTSSLDSAEARGTIRVRIKITPQGGTPVYAQPNSGSDATGATTTDGVVYCDRIQKLEARFSGLNCTADLLGAVTCAESETLRLILKTLNANAFNFVAADLGSGVHTVEVQARSSAATGVLGANGSLASANAFIGAGSVAVESVRMVKGMDGSVPVDIN